MKSELQMLVEELLHGGGGGLLLTVTVSPHLMPMPIRAIRRVASTDLPFLSTMVTVLWQVLASFASIPAGRAWMPTGSLMVYVNSFIAFSSHKCAAVERGAIIKLLL